MEKYCYEEKKDSYKHYYFDPYEGCKCCKCCKCRKEKPCYKFKCPCGKLIINQYFKCFPEKHDYCYKKDFYPKKHCKEKEYYHDSYGYYPQEGYWYYPQESCGCNHQYENGYDPYEYYGQKDFEQRDYNDWENPGFSQEFYY
ncbi:MAG: hypothetical protein GX196_06880 [Clostridiaceae bacterium]|nr:hypothetical protein [Clostridiaceae bacterium]